MLGTVLVPLDGSGFAECALPLARRLVANARARLYLATADQAVGAAVGGSEISAVFAALSQDLIEDDERYLASTASQLGEVGRGPVLARLLDGPAGEAICEEAGRIGADLIVMATHGRNTMGRLWLGSVADHVVRHAHRPVLLVKPPRVGGRSPERPIRNILVPLDPSLDSEAILEPVLTVASLLGATVTLLTIVAPRFGIAEPELPPPMPQHPAISARRSDQAHARLDRLARFYQAAGLDVRTRVALAATPAGGILQVLEDPRFDMVAMATLERPGFHRLITGSVADRVIRSTTKPALIYHPRRIET